MDEKLLIESDEFTILAIAKNLVLYAIVVRNLKIFLIFIKNFIFQVASLMTMATIVYAVVRKELALYFFCLF